MIPCRYFIQSTPEVSVLLLPASFSTRTIGECDRSLGSDVGLQPHRQTNYVNHVIVDDKRKIPSVLDADGINAAMRVLWTGKGE
jgi:hypothetical protein